MNRKKLFSVLRYLILPFATTHKLICNISGRKHVSLLPELTYQGKLKGTNFVTARSLPRHI